MLPVPKSEIVEATDTDAPETSCSVAKYVAGTIADELCELGQGEPVRGDPRGATCSDRNSGGLPGLS
jgi:hypothetical protein